MSYDRWKTTEPAPGEDWAECAACGHRDTLRKMRQVRNEHDRLEWRCDDCSPSEETAE